MPQLYVDLNSILDSVCKLSQAVGLATSTQRRALPVSDSVRDDWDDDEEAEEEDPQKLWEEA